MRFILLSSLTLFLIAATGVAAQGLEPGQVESVLALPAGDFPEGVAFDSSGSMYVGNRRIVAGVRLAEILKVDGGKVSVIATLGSTTQPGAAGLLGLATDGDGDLYAALDSRVPSSHGVWRISGNGKKKARLAGSENIGFPNALTFDAKGNLYASDSEGAIWKYGGSSPCFEKWVAHDLLAPYPFDPLPIPLPGANGIAFFPPNNIYVANTEKGLIARVPVEQDGSAGTPHLVAASFALLTVDGIAVDAHGDIHGVIAGYTVLGGSPLVRVNASTGQVTPTVIQAGQMAKFDVPLSVAFGTAPGQKTVFITNGALPVPLVPPGPGPGVVRAGVGVPGF